MRNVLSIKISQLEKGMVLAEDILHNPSGVTLLPAGTTIDERALKAINLFPIHENCLIYDPTDLSEEPVYQERTSPEQAVPGQTAKSSKKIASPIPEAGAAYDFFEQKPPEDLIDLPEAISQQARTIYRSTFKTVRNFYEKSRLDNTMNMAEIQKASSEIASEVTRDPQVLLQIAVLKAIDDYTFSHAVHVAIYATTLGKLLRFSERELHQISMAGLLHDIGKVDVPDEILNKPGKLTDEEFNIMKQHVRYSFNRVYRFEGITRDLLSAIGQHHERIDGSGYLQRLEGSEIHKWARILAIADVYDAVTTNRTYGEGLLPHEGAEILMGSTGHLDSSYLNLFIRQISFYPVGCRIMLNTGEVGTVIANNPEMPLRPVLQVTGSDGSGIRVINLMDSLTTFITHIIKQGN